ncbi:5-(carboxyamino)imidazole ribonucleotide mutase [Moheibacter sediminis]|uniref:N5-carboxyaminoimidazole ribonucleotide mutase n=1 Tax=Moheibacter sediminis TaxID=1434700 RepID=A0A1W1ZS85_9FLAO|nr:5-(carboxyamino)imidazole ribonucleotide mutase [Moheibacter sediminis]SMC51246.1 5-(carboxyamino)imidazole ribonucleotide mutase [Moheibacter sediminis]
MVGIIMGSDSDLPIMKQAGEILSELGVEFELTIVSAHRTPERMFDYAKSAKERGLKIIIAGAGGAAHLPGMVASLTTLPVIGVPIKSSNSVDGWDSILSILQMPNGIPVATVALNGAKNAGLLAARMIGSFDEKISSNLTKYHIKMKGEVEAKIQKVKGEFRNEFD